MPCMDKMSQLRRHYLPKQCKQRLVPTLIAGHIWVEALTGLQQLTHNTCTCSHCCTIRQCYCATTGPSYCTYLHRALFVDARAVVLAVTSERYVQHLQELVHAGEKGGGCVGNRLDRGHPLKNHNPVSQIGGHDEVVLNHKGRLLGMKDEPFDDACCNNTLLRVKIG